MKVLRSILSVLMAMLILSVSTGWSISQHFCQGKLWDSSLFGQAPDCGMEVVETILQDHKTPTFSEEPCCEKQQITVNIKDSTTLLKAKDGSPLIKQVELLAVFSSVFLTHFSPSASAADTWLEGYSPPLTNRDIPLLTQSFLI